MRSNITLHVMSGGKVMKNSIATTELFIAKKWQNFNPCSYGEMGGVLIRPLGTVCFRCSSGCIKY